MSCRTEARSLSEGCMSVASHQLDDTCPSSGWQGIRDLISLQGQITPLLYKNQFGYSQGPSQIGITDRTSIRQLTAEEDEAYLGTGPRPIISGTQHAAISDALTSTGGLWALSLTNVTARRGHGSPFSDQSDAIHSISKGYKQPYSTIVCVPDSVTSGDDMTPIGIPHLPNANPAPSANGNITYEKCFGGGQTTAQTIAHPLMTRGQMFNLSGSGPQYTLHWTELDPGLFQGSSIGAIVALPRAPQNNSQDVLIYNLSAGWGTATISVHTNSGGVSAVTSRPINDNHSTGGVSIKSTNIPISEGNDGPVDYHLPYYPEQVINISQDWAQYLNPEISGLNTTVIDTLLQNWIFACSPRISAEVALGTLIVNGLAKSGAGSQLQGTIRTSGPQGVSGLDGNFWVSGKGNVFSVDPKQSEDWVKLHVESTLQGYAYNTINMAPRVAIAFLTLYCVFAFGHVLYVAWSGKHSHDDPHHNSVLILTILGISSTSWDSISEITALAMNSTPTTALRNTCAGITELGIFKLPVRVLVREDAEGEGEHLELVVGDVEQEKNDKSTVKPNRACGTMPLLKKVE